jgi:aromatic-L-amino-acid decarboxylase
MSEPKLPPLGDLPPEEFRRVAHEAVDWIADYLAGVGELPAFPQVEPGFLKSALPATGPETGESMDRLLEDFQELIVPGINHWNHPGFHGWFGNTGSAPGILGEMLTAALNVNVMLWRSSPAATELEEVTLGWLRALLGLPDTFFGTINDTASTSTLYALAAARDAALPGGTLAGLSGASRLRCYASSEAHSSVDKAVLTLGLGREGMRRIPVTERLEMDPEALRAAIREDREAGWTPMAAVATIGTTSTTAVDPVHRVAQVCRDEGVWLHVDAAYGGPLAALPEFSDLFFGWDRADSIVVNPHKWLFTPIGCSVLWCSRPERLRGAFSLVPEYLRTAEADQVVNLMDYGVALGRRFRSLKLWFVLRAFGAEGIRARLREHLRLAGVWARWIESTPGWVLAAPSVMATPVFRYDPAEAEAEAGAGGGVGGGDQLRMDGEALDRLNEAIIDRVNASGIAFLSHGRVGERLVIRLSIGNLRTTESHLARTWAALNEAVAELLPAFG